MKRHLSRVPVRSSAALPSGTAAPHARILNEAQVQSIIEYIKTLGEQGER